jgi:dihydroflavonol-4-reductase
MKRNNPHKMLRPNILLTGAGGYLGRNLVPSLNNYFKVRAHYRHSGHSLAYTESNSYGDLLERKTTSSIVDGVKYIIHAAAILPNGENEFLEKDYFDANYEISLNLAQVALKQGVEKFIYISSANIYSPSLKVATESSAIGDFVKHPLYLQSKVNTERDLLELFSEEKSELVILRIGTPYGCDEQKSKLIPHLMTTALKNQNLILSAPEQTTLNYIYMPDLIKSVVKLITRDVNGVFNISNSFTLGMLSEEILSLINSTSRVISIHNYQNSDFKTFSKVSSEKLLKEIDFKFMTLEDSLREYLNYVSTP